MSEETSEGGTAAAETLALAALAAATWNWFKGDK